MSWSILAAFDQPVSAQINERPRGKIAFRGAPCGVVSCSVVLPGLGRMPAYLTQISRPQRFSKQRM